MLRSFSAAICMRQLQAQVAPHQMGVVAFPMANVRACFNVLWPIVDGGTVFDRIARRSRPTWPSALVMAGQITPELLALAGSAIDRLEPQGPQAALMASLEPSGNLFRRPSFRKTIANEACRFRKLCPPGWRLPPNQNIIPADDGNAGLVHRGAPFDWFKIPRMDTILSPPLAS